MQSEPQLNVYRGCAPVVESWYDTDGDRTVTDAITAALAEAMEAEATDIGPLYEAIDLDAVAHLFNRHDGADDEEVTLCFTFDHWNVFVHSNGQIQVCDGTRTSEPVPVFEQSPA